MDSFLLFLLILGIWTCLFIAGISLYNYYLEKQKIRSTLDNVIPPWKVLKQKTSRKELLHQWMDQFAPFGQKVQILSDPAELEDLLVKAGYPFGLTVSRLQGAKILSFLLGLVIACLYYLIGLPFASVMFIVLLFLGYMGPIYLVRMLAKRRQEQIRYDLPDFLDMMSITLQAGMGMDEALAYYVETSKGPLSEEFARLNQEIKFGVQREAAYRSLLRRVTSSELEALVQSLIQAHNLGTPIAQIFAQQAEDMRRMRSEKAKELAGKAAPKISLVSGLIIAPSIMLLILSAIIYNFFIKNSLF